MKVRWTTPASLDLESIGSFLFQRSPRAATRIIARIWSRTASLADLPFQGRPGRVEGTRELVVTDTPFIVAYRLKDDEIEVLAVYHGARRWPESF